GMRPPGGTAAGWDISPRGKEGKMRTTKWLIAAALGLGMADTASAQDPSTNPFLSSVGPLKYNVIGPDANSRLGGLQFLSTNNSPQRYFNTNAGTITNQPVVGRSIWPTYSQLPGDDYA